jgi:hypothetical protein
VVRPDWKSDLLGLGKVAAGLKGLLIETWDRVIFYRERKFENHLTLIEKTLPILDQIGAMEHANNISREGAEMLRRGIFDRMTTFIKPDRKKRTVHQECRVWETSKSRRGGKPF